MRHVPPRALGRDGPAERVGPRGRAVARERRLGDGGHGRGEAGAGERRRIAGRAGRVERRTPGRSRHRRRGRRVDGRARRRARFPPWNRTSIPATKRAAAAAGSRSSCGSMFSGKTEELIRRLRRATIARQRVALFKPAIDTRYDADAVVSHDATAMPSTVITAPEQMLLLVGDADVVGIDEAQFFGPELVRVVEELARDGRRVVVAGLDQDFLGRPFEPVPQLMAVAEHVTQAARGLRVLRRAGQPLAAHRRRGRARARRREGRLRAALPDVLRPGGRRRRRPGPPMRRQRRPRPLGRSSAAAPGVPRLHLDRGRGGRYRPASHLAASHGPLAPPVAPARVSTAVRTVRVRRLAAAFLDVLLALTIALDAGRAGGVARRARPEPRVRRSACCSARPTCCSATRSRTPSGARARWASAGSASARTTSTASRSTGRRPRGATRPSPPPSASRP